MIGRFLSRIFDVEEINGDGRCPTYLYRWALLRLGGWCSIYLHKFVGDDWSLDLHDHPKRFVSIGLWGWYDEQTDIPADIASWLDGVAGTELRATTRRRWRAPWVRTFRASHRHRLTGPTREHPCWTIVIVGRAVRQWGFWPRGQFVPWRKYVNGPAGDAGKACQ